MKHIPEYFSITDDDIKHLLGEGKSLESEIEVRHKTHVLLYVFKRIWKTEKKNVYSS